MSVTHYESNEGMAATAPDDRAAPRTTGWKRLGTIALNVWLCYHLFAIVICPASVAPATPIVQSGWNLVAGYLQLFYLNHGFHFFAPDPAGSSLVRCELAFPDQTTRTVQYPNRTLWPRLFYHRHFMLTEFLGNGPTEYRPYLERAIARQLCRTTGAERATLFLVYHETASVDDVLAGQSLNEPGMFTEEALGSYLATELAQPYQPPVEAPAATIIADDEAVPPSETAAPPDAERDESTPPDVSFAPVAP